MLRTVKRQIRQHFSFPAAAGSFVNTFAESVGSFSGKCVERKIIS